MSARHCLLPHINMPLPATAFLPVTACCRTFICHCHLLHVCQTLPAAAHQTAPSCYCMSARHCLLLHTKLPLPAIACLPDTACCRTPNCPFLLLHVCQTLLAAAHQLATACSCMSARHCRCISWACTMCMPLTACMGCAARHVRVPHLLHLMHPHVQTFKTSNKPTPALMLQRVPSSNPSLIDPLK